MNTKLQQAIVATRDGDKQQAQRLLTELLKENPQDAQAWFLLSHLVESESKQVAYLSKVLALQPTHEKAKQRLAKLTSAVSVPTVIATEKVSPLSVATPEVVIQPPPVVVPSLAKVEAEKTAVIKAETVKLPPPPMPKPPPATKTPPAAKPPLSKKALAAQTKRQKQQQQYNYMMIGLAVLAAVILLLLVSQLL